MPPKKAFIGRTRLLWVMTSIPFKAHKISKAISPSSVVEIHPSFQYLKLLGFPQPFPALRHQRYDARRATVFAKRLFNNQSSERFFCSVSEMPFRSTYLNKAFFHENKIVVFIFSVVYNRRCGSRAVQAAHENSLDR